MAYASGADLVTRFRYQSIAQLVSDGEVAIAEDEIADDARVAAALDDASGQIDAALLAAARYSASDLSGLTGNSLAYLKRICCELAYANLLRRNGSVTEAEANSKEAMDALERLRKGVNVFGLADNIDAGLPDSEGPSVQQIINSNRITERTPHYFAPFQSRLPLDRR